METSELEDLMERIIEAATNAVLICHQSRDAGIEDIRRVSEAGRKTIELMHQTVAALHGETPMSPRVREMFWAMLHEYEGELYIVASARVQIAMQLSGELMYALCGESEEQEVFHGIATYRPGGEHGRGRIVAKAYELISRVDETSRAIRTDPEQMH